HTRFSRDWSSDVCSSDLNIKKIRMSKKSIVTLIILLFQIPLFAQNISLEQAFEMADKNNLSIKSNELLESYQSKKKASYLNIPRSEERRVGKEYRCRRAK